MDSVRGDGRKKRPRAKPKPKGNVRIIIRQDKLGKFILVHGVKYRIGKDVSNADVARFGVNKTRVPREPDINTAVIRQEVTQALIEQKAQEKREDEYRNKEANEKHALAVHQANIARLETLQGKLERTPVYYIKAIADDVYTGNPSIKRASVKATKEELIDYILSNAPKKFDFKPKVPQPPAPSSSSSSPAPAPTPTKIPKFNFKPKPPSSSSSSSKAAVSDDEEDDTTGNGTEGTDRGLSNFQIDAIMKKFPEYLGTISHDEVRSRILPKVQPQSRGGFVINTDPERKPGEHWQSVFWDARPNGEHEIDFFDSYGDPIDKELQRDLLSLATKLDAGTYLKFKENRIKLQNDRSSNCGWFAVQFLMDRFRGKPFSDASGYNNSIHGEASVERFKAQHGGARFGYMPSFKQGGLSAPALRTDYPPKVRKYLTDTPIKSISVCRKPIQGAVNALLNVVSAGGWQSALKTVGIDKALHLYMVINGNTVLERNHVVEMYSGGEQSGSECMRVSVPLGLTFKKLLESTAARVGASLQVYDARDNSCQVFLTQVLRSNGLLTPQLDSFINQDLKGVFEHLPSFVGSLAKKVTDVAHKADVVVHGVGRIREVPADPVEKKYRTIQTILFDKGLWTPIKAESWLERNDFKHDSFDDKKHFYRYRQFTPFEGGDFRTFTRNLPEGVEFVMEY